jgi:hypothetical protein
MGLYFLRTEFVEEPIGSVRTDCSGLVDATPHASGSKGSDNRGQIFRGGGRVGGCGHEDGTSTAQVPQGWERRELSRHWQPKLYLWEFIFPTLYHKKLYSPMQIFYHEVYLIFSGIFYSNFIK